MPLLVEHRVGRPQWATALDVLLGKLVHQELGQVERRCGLAILGLSGQGALELSNDGLIQVLFLGALCSTNMATEGTALEATQQVLA